MKKLIVAAAALAVAVIGLGSVGLPTASANPTNVMLINENVANALLTGQTPSTMPCTPAGVNAVASQLSTLAAASANQVNSDQANAGPTCLVVQTDGSTSPITVNGRGLTCATVCDGTGGSAITPVTGSAGTFAAEEITGFGANYASSTITVVQDSISIDSAAVKPVSQAHDVALVVTKPTIQEQASSCAITDSTSAPTRGGAALTFTDINGNALVGYDATWASSSTATMSVALPASVSMMISGTTTIAAGNVYCGVAAGTANLNGTAPGSEVSGITTGVTRTQAITVTGVPAAIALTASPAAIACNGTNTSTVSATVTDSAGNNVVDGTSVTFSVVALGTANPVTTTTTGGTASSVITPLSGTTAGTVVTVTAGTVSQQITIACQQALLTPTAPAAAATATPKGGVVGPNTGTGGYLGSSSSTGFPMWALAALALASVVLVGGGVVVRRTGK